MQLSSDAEDLQPGKNSDRTKSDVEQVLKHLPIPVFICNNHGDLLYFNDFFKQIGMETDAEIENIRSLEALSFSDIYTNQPINNASLIDRLNSNELEVTNLKAQFKADSLKPYKISIDKINFAQNSECLRFCFTPTESLKLDEIKQTVLSAIVESSDDAIISKDLNGYITSWNQSATRIFGYSEEEIVGKHISILFPPDRIDDEQMIIETIKNGEQIDHFETLRLKKGGEEILISVTISPIRNASGKIIGASKIVRDISDRYKQELKQAMLSSIVSSSDDAIISKNLDGIITSWNLGATRIFGYSEQEMLGTSVKKLIPENRINEEDIIINNIKSGKRIAHFETKRLAKDGKKIPVSISVSPIKDSTGKIIGASKIARNIKDRRKAKQKIKKYNQKLEIINTIGTEISSNLDVQIVLQKVTDATTKLSGAKFGAFFYNSEDESGEAMMLYTLSGATKEDFEKLGMPRLTQIFKPTFGGQGILRIDDIKSDPRYGNNPPHKGMPIGHLPVSSYMAIPVITSSGNVIGGLIFGHPEKGKFKEDHENIVKNIATQAAIALDNSRLFERVRSLSEKKDEFIALASHELKTPLTTVIGYLQVLEKKIKEPLSRKFLSKSLDQTYKLNSLIEDLLNMSRIEAGKLDFSYEDFDITAMLQDLSETFNDGENTHNLISNIGDQPLMVTADKQRIEQVVRNLLSNAVKYSPQAEEIYLDLNAKDNKVIVKVRDNGIGLTPQQKKQVFNRFYRAETTKGINGLGLGLYLTKQIIDGHDEELIVKTEIGVGSEFCFTLERAH